MTRRVLVAVLLVLTVAGCSAIATSGELGRAGYSVSGVSTAAVNGFTTVTVDAEPPPGRAPAAAVEEAQRIVWRTHPGPVDRLVVTIGGLGYTADADELAARFGPRDPALAGPRTDPAAEVRSVFTVIAGVIAGVGVLLGIAALVVVVAARRRGPADPGPDATAVVGARIAQYVVDYAVWATPVLVVFAALFVAVANDVPGAGPLLAVWFVGAVLWGWASYAWWAARHDGRTIGMRRLGLRVVDVATGGPVPLGRHTVRWLMFALDGAAVGLVGLLTLVLGRLHQRVGDLAARTVVVRDPVPGETSHEP